MSSLAAARADNFYYPPHFDPVKHGTLAKLTGQHPLRERAARLSEGILVIRFEVPFNIWCEQCGEMIAKGVRFNADKQSVGNYLSTKIWKFTMRHHCGCKISIQTDPKNAAYVITEGARKKVEEYTAASAEVIDLGDSKDKAALADPFYRLEHGNEVRVRTSSAAQALAALVDAQDIRHHDPYSINKALRARLRNLKAEDAALDAQRDALGLSKGVKLLAHNEFDAGDAALAFFKNDAAAQRSKQRQRQDIMSQSIFTPSLCPAPSPVSSNVARGSAAASQLAHSTAHPHHRHTSSAAAAAAPAAGISSSAGRPVFPAGNGKAASIKTTFAQTVSYDNGTARSLDPNPSSLLDSARKRHRERESEHHRDPSRMSSSSRREHEGDAHHLSHHPAAQRQQASLPGDSQQTPGKRKAGDRGVASDYFGSVEAWGAPPPDRPTGLLSHQTGEKDSNQQRTRESNAASFPDVFTYDPELVDGQNSKDHLDDQYSHHHQQQHQNHRTSSSHQQHPFLAQQRTHSNPTPVHASTTHHQHHHTQDIARPTSHTPNKSPPLSNPARGEAIPKRSICLPLSCLTGSQPPSKSSVAFATPTQPAQPKSYIEVLKSESTSTTTGSGGAMSHSRAMSHSGTVSHRAAVSHSGAVATAQASISLSTKVQQQVRRQQQAKANAALQAQTTLQLPSVRASSSGPAPASAKRTLNEKAALLAKRQRLDPGIRLGLTVPKPSSW